ncbi:MAG: hypothetical protein V4739_14285 [Pseudomonadota bacterium]
MTTTTDINPTTSTTDRVKWDANTPLTPALIQALLAALNATLTTPAPQEPRVLPNGLISRRIYDTPNGIGGGQRAYNLSNITASTEAVRTQLHEADARNGNLLTDAQEAELAAALPLDSGGELEDSRFMAAYAARFAQTHDAADAKLFASTAAQLGMPREVAVALASRVTPEELKNADFMAHAALLVPLANAGDLKNASLEKKVDAVLKYLRNPSQSKQPLITPRTVSEQGPRATLAGFDQALQTYGAALGDRASRLSSLDNATRSQIAGSLSEAQLKDPVFMQTFLAGLAMRLDGTDPAALQSAIHEAKKWATQAVAAGLTPQTALALFNDRTNELPSELQWLATLTHRRN